MVKFTIVTAIICYNILIQKSKMSFQESDIYSGFSNNPPEIYNDAGYDEAFQNALRTSSYGKRNPTTAFVVNSKKMFKIDFFFNFNFCVTFRETLQLSC